MNCHYPVSRVLGLLLVAVMLSNTCNADESGQRDKLSVLFLERRGSNVEALQIVVNDLCMLSYSRNAKRFSGEAEQIQCGKIRREIELLINDLEMLDASTGSRGGIMVVVCRDDVIVAAGNHEMPGAVGVVAPVFRSRGRKSQIRERVETSGLLVKNSLLYDLLWSLDEEKE